MRLFPSADLNDVSWCQRQAEALAENQEGQDLVVAATISSMVAMMNMFYS